MNDFLSPFQRGTVTGRRELGGESDEGVIPPATSHFLQIFFFLDIRLDIPYILS